METRALIKKPGTPRALYAAALLVALLAALLGAWFFSGWHDVRMRQHEVREAPRRAAAERAAELSRELSEELASLVAREARRPYFHYQNLMHDPKASAGLSVSPSPLARGPEDKLVLGYFQIDAKGRATTPTVNDDFPDLSEPDNFADNRSFRDQVVRDLVRDLTPPQSPILVAEVTPPKPEPRPHPKPHPKPHGHQPPIAQTQAQTNALPVQQTQVIEVDPNVYVQNNYPNQVYWQQQGNNDQFKPQQIQRQAPKPPQAPHVEQPPQVATPPAPEVAPKPAVTEPKPAVTQPKPRKPPPPKVEEKPAPITITISPLEWRTLAFAGAQSLIAVRSVQTPDGNLAQGFVVDRSSLTSWLATKAGEMVAELHTNTDRGVDVAPGWQLTVSPNPRRLAQAHAEAKAVARTFLIRFFGIGGVAALAATFVLMLVMRAEKLARERSQFAAAAAHELRTPLAGLQLYGDMLADGLGDPAKVRDYARRMSEEASRLGRVVSNVLGFSQLERGNLSVDAQVGAVGEALRELAERAEPALDRAGAALELDVSPELRARFDRDALARIVGNLLDNAEKYSRAADDRTIRLAARDKGDVIEITVEDRGPGVADRTKLFRAFSRGVAADGPAGLGLGLALSASLAQAMGGKLVHQPSETGATFVLELARA